MTRKKNIDEWGGGGLQGFDTPEFKPVSKKGMTQGPPQQFTADWNNDVKLNVHPTHRETTEFESAFETAAAEIKQKRARRRSWIGIIMLAVLLGGLEACRTKALHHIFYGS